MPELTPEWLVPYRAALQPLIQQDLAAGHTADDIRPAVRQLLNDLLRPATPQPAAGPVNIHPPFTSPAYHEPLKNGSPVFAGPRKMPALVILFNLLQLDAAITQDGWKRETLEELFQQDPGHDLQPGTCKNIIRTGRRAGFFEFYRAQGQEDWSIRITSQGKLYAQHALPAIVRWYKENRP